MKFKQFLNEEESFEKFLLNLKNDCSDFISDAEKPLWRGIKNSPTFGIIEPVENRKPKDSGSDLFFNNCFNLGIEQITKISTIRSKALFCSSGFSQTLIYGKSHFIFPSNDCKYIFSNFVYDSYEDVNFNRNTFQYIFHNHWINTENILVKIPNLTIDDCLKHAKTQKIQEIAKKTIKDLGYALRLDFNYNISSNISDATENKVTHEILCYGAKKYYKINVEFLIKYLKIKDNNSAIFHQTLFSKLLDKLNA